MCVHAEEIHSQQQTAKIIIISRTQNKGKDQNEKKWGRENTNENSSGFNGFAGSHRGPASGRIVGKKKQEIKGEIYHEGEVLRFHWLNITFERIQLEFDRQTIKYSVYIGTKVHVRL